MKVGSKRKWTLVGFSALLTTALFLATRGRPDPLEPLSKYIDRDITVYFDAETARAAYGMPKMPAISERSVDLKGAPTKELETVLKHLATPIEDWDINPSSRESFSFGAWRKPDYFEEISASKLDARMEGGVIVPVKGFYSVTIRKPLSKWDVVLLWVKHRGHPYYADFDK